MFVLFVTNERTGLVFTPSENERFLTAKQVRERYAGASTMWLYRREHDGSGFPKSVVIAGRKLWRLSELETWERSLATKSDLARHLAKKDTDENEAATH
jgi:predicted DNA-binding transcriptional regulator AlpA